MVLRFDWAAVRSLPVVANCPWHLAFGAEPRNTHGADDHLVDVTSRFWPLRRRRPSAPHGIVPAGTRRPCHPCLVVLVVLAVQASRGSHWRQRLPHRRSPCGPEHPATTSASATLNAMKRINPPLRAVPKRPRGREVSRPRSWRSARLKVRDGPRMGFRCPMVALIATLITITARMHWLTNPDRTFICPDGETWRFSAFITPILANMVGPPFSATSNSASAARLHTLRTGGIGGLLSAFSQCGQAVRRAKAPLT